MFMFQLFPDINQNPIQGPAAAVLKSGLDQALEYAPEIGEWSDRERMYMAGIPVGIEIEVENAAKLAGKYQWNINTDNSLRGDAAYEYKTPYGITMSQGFLYLSSLHAAVEGYRKKMKVAYNDEVAAAFWSFSERTSVHVHLDVRNFTVDQMYNLIQLYMIFEDALFRHAGPIRKHNIFCIPFCSAEGMAEGKLRNAILSNEKYCALNLQAVAHFGTVEFRHMEGTLDLRRLFTWLALLARLHYRARTMSREEMFEHVCKLKGESMYQQFAAYVFGNNLSRLLRFDVDVMDAAVSDCKVFTNAENK